MADDIQVDIKITVPVSVEAAGDMPDKWAAGLVNNAAVINDRRIAKIGDEGTFQSKVAVPSSAKFTPMIDAAFVSNAGRNKANIDRAQYKNLAGAFDHWNDKLALSFATVDGVVAKRFKDQVNNSKDAWATAVAQKTLRATGDKIRGTYLGQALYWLTGDYRANGMTNSLEVVAGAPYQFMATNRRAAWKAATMGMMVHALMMILNADFLAAEIASQNDVLVAFCNNVKSAPVKSFIRAEDAIGTDSTFSFDYADPTLTLIARVVLT